MPASSIHSTGSILTSPSPTNLGGNTKMFETVGGKGKRRSKKYHKKHRKSVKKNKTKRFFFF